MRFFHVLSVVQSRNLSRRQSIAQSYSSLLLCPFRLVTKQRKRNLLFSLLITKKRMFVSPMAAEGPTAYKYAHEQGKCLDYWWANLLFINNFVPSSCECLFLGAVAFFSFFVDRRKHVYGMELVSRFFEVLFCPFRNKKGIWRWTCSCLHLWGR
jgi:hypothetical protein